MDTTQELAWLRFNHRVLEQTRRPDFPVLERLRFLGIWASNLDEFFAARIWRPFLELRKTEAYAAIVREVRAQTELASRAYEGFLPELARLGIRIVSVSELTHEERLYFGAFLAEEVAPRTDVIRAEALREMRSQALYFASGTAVLQHLIRLPDSVPRLLEIPGREGTYVRLGELLRLRPDLFLTRKDARLHELRVVRLAAIDQTPIDWSDLPVALESRLDGRVSHLEVERGFPRFWTESMRLALGLEAHEVMQVVPPLDLRFVNTIVEKGPARAKFGPLEAKHPPRFAEAPFACLDQGDVVLFHPYQSYEAVEAFARAAAADPDVTAVRATLYRVGEDNVLATSLIAAARAGKEVAVLLEGRARFDELTNMEWALRFRNAGVRVLPLPEKKVHAKVIWIARGRHSYLHVGTGNYNTTNGRHYTDLSLFTRHAGLTADAKAFFDSLEEQSAPRLGTMRTGHSIRELLVERIRAEGHPEGHVILKFNHLTDPAVLGALDESARGGARVDLIVRTTLTHITPAARARSLVGRFLEHARVMAFRGGGAWEVWAGSFDAMPRNFDRRYELMFPVADPVAKQAVLDNLRAQLRDDVNAFALEADGSERPRWGGDFNCQRPDAVFSEHRAPPEQSHAPRDDPAEGREHKLVQAPQQRRLA
jgi:polyphosphate kinase